MTGQTPEGLPAGYTFHEDFEITPDHARSLLDAGEAILLDVRQPFEHEAARIEGATLIPLPELEQRHDELDVEADERVLVLCHHGVRSVKAALMLRALGYTNVWSIAAGIDWWSQRVDPAVPRYTK
ncbi:MAG: rhodanese-like domain-containing protein [Planctomycetota bacterium]